MARGEMKEAAEAVLRELPSVVGAFVREDVYGHPREVHLLVRPGPEPRALAHDIRELLEERLGVAVDQRVISIAQLATDFTSTGAGASEPPANAQPQQPVPAKSPTRVLRRDPDPRLRFLGLETQVRDARILVRARLSAGERELLGEAVEVEVAHGRARAGAAATLQAISRVAGLHGRFELEDASLLRVFDRDHVLVSAFASSPYLGRRPLTLSGAHPVEVDVESAAALAALKAVNRVLGLMLRLGPQGALS